MKKISSEFVRNLILIIIVGFLAGALGALAAWGMLLSYRSSLILSDIPGTLDYRLAPREDSFELAEKQAELVLADFFIAKRGESVRYFPEEAFARGAVLSSDGWILASSEVSRRPIAQIRAGIGPQLFEITDAVEDKDAGLVFLKVEARNLAAAALSREPLFGGTVLAAATPHGSRELFLAKSPSSKPFNSDLVPPVFSFSDAEAILPGTPLFDESGRLVGLADSSENIVSSGMIRPALDSLLALGEIRRPALGLFGFHLSGTRSSAVGRDRGFLLARPASGAAAVRKGSAAEAAGLREGDIILKWNDTVLNGAVLLPELLLAKRPGDKVELRVARGDEELSVIVEIGVR